MIPERKERVFGAFQDVDATGQHSRLIFIRHHESGGSRLKVYAERVAEMRG